MKYLVLIWLLLFVGCQPSFAERDIQITDKSCQVAVDIAKVAMSHYRKGANQYDVMSAVNGFKVENNEEAYAGKVYAQLAVLDIQKNIRRGYTNTDILKVYVENCKGIRGSKFAKGK
ncbi:hypothetical protein AVT69_gp301 [Pseudomonas phage PhiPA3]|uniref:Uncharacterized protein 303 n=1 Tax=Pseudomonas phage PhiPA3 TaxID=998086 RepID=F8SJD9_BPPA3|nr:hypothetical protein AVT69_gp301 [Pseudomonas phage PhiPA3]AEH03726.1 hypothetical protein [Pseudomonas phage PhiPA3]